ncbi:hypothetical protein BGZ97_006748 [Linnemannia gamsii]|uniref:Endoribonuclease YicC-like C-terminal domain-containing protein n=1 Tax=Linnemannia gamsii TaxID=64522 RepID=A0A9P6RRU4_9FUNG|nr:hypothetical protein BGZ97_006748 [Linnemannia gamsii]
MMIYSMTGYANATHEVPIVADSDDPPTSVSVELRTVNSRFLDLNFRIPDEVRASEPILREMLTQKLGRGKVEIRINLQRKLMAKHQQKIVERLQEALGLATAGNAPALVTPEETAERIRQEMTIYGIRIDINEELSRLSAHLNETRRITQQGGRVGKRLDFMMQELNREANTLGSKAAAKELADTAMSLKLLIEQMREQIQNLE